MLKKLHALYSTKRLERIFKEELTRTEYMAKVHELQSKTDEELNVIMQDAVERYPEITAYKYLATADEMLRNKYKGRYDDFSKRYRDFTDDVETDLIMGFGKSETEDVLKTFIRLNMPSFNRDCERLAKDLEEKYNKECELLNSSEETRKNGWGKIHLTMNKDGFMEPDIKGLNLEGNTDEG